ncbi:C-C motif chemokine 20-like [Denticeps clupeoides]|uniref:C-C motif chemokine 20-like n=1 Tax=Denticeps clupeoides TaxID=299321 RepID=UPI0010A3F1CF|nr:C-C motif chemokine 20-like [Denticeps clupeoides]
MTASYISSLSALALVLLLCSSCSGELALDCCLRTRDTKIPHRLLAEYTMQYRSLGCNIDAVIFRTIKGRSLCAPTDSDAVKERIRYLDTLLKRCQEKNFEGQKCKHVKRQ